MATATVELPPKLIPVFEGEARVRGAFGGRGSGKTRGFAKMTAIKAYIWANAGREGIILCGRQFMNSLDDSSLEEIKAAIRSEPWLADFFEIGEKFIRTKCGRISYKFTGLDRNIDSIKSKARILLAWIDEAEPVTEQAWQKLIPTIREEGSELWVTWNPESKRAPVHKRFRETKADDVKIVELNYRDNPWFPKVLERERLEDQRERPDSYAHIWEGEFATVVTGAYYAALIEQAKADGRVANLAADPLMTIRLVCDIGGTGARADAFAIWAVQFIGREIRWLDYYEAVGQPLAAHVNWMRSRGYTPETAQIWLPHDGATHDKVYSVSPESALRDAGYSVTVVPNQGRGAANARIEVMRRLFPRMWFDAKRCEAGLDALAAYHEKRDEARGIGLGPEHDWSSHGCLTAGQIVKTKRGDVPIENIKVGDEVLTPGGYGKVAASGQTKLATELIELELSNGTTLTATPEHKIFTTIGVVLADAIRYGDAIFTREDMECLRSVSGGNAGYRGAFIESFAGTGGGIGRSAACMSHKKVVAKGCSTARRLATGSRRWFLSMGIGTTLPRAIGCCDSATQAERHQSFTHGRNSKGCGIIRMVNAAIMRAGRRLWFICTAQFGSITTVPFLRGCTFITSTGTSPITGLKTSKCLPQASIQNIMPKPILGLEATLIGGSLPKFGKKQHLGTEAKKGALGIAPMRRNHTESTCETATCAVSNMERNSQRGECIAARVVRLRRYECEPTPVYDLTVERHHCYFANGVLVSNSDAAGLGAIIYEEPRQAKPLDLTKLKRAIL